MEIEKYFFLSGKFRGLVAYCFFGVATFMLGGLHIHTPCCPKDDTSFVSIRWESVLREAGRESAWLSWHMIVSPQAVDSPPIFRSLQMFKCTVYFFFSSPYSLHELLDTNTKHKQTKKLISGFDSRNSLWTCCFFFLLLLPHLTRFSSFL